MISPILNARSPFIANCWKSGCNLTPLRPSSIKWSKSPCISSLSGCRVPNPVNISEFAFTDSPINSLMDLTCFGVVATEWTK